MSGRPAGTLTYHAADAAEVLERVTKGLEEWSLDRDWQPAVFGVATSRPRVLLTIGANAQRTLCQAYETALRSRHPRPTGDVMAGHVAYLRAADASLIDARRAITRSRITPGPTRG